MPRIDNETFYTAALNLHGIGAKGVNWRDEHTQKVRFKVLLGMLPEDMHNYDIVDAGCGFGDLYLFLRAHAKAPKSYLGIDALETMCALTQERTACQTLCADICRDTLPSADFYVCSGALNILTEFESVLFLRNCFMACREGFVFNVLHGTKESTTYNYMTKKRITQIAKELGVKHLEFQEGYLQQDISVFFGR
ncbi:MAG: class I SAM-dependent methyltransferase [Thiovulaceae bacterium]|nr:class I SAM-dependent methyltransferase [Sulfurimonadaceae bacterium]